jgi:DNA-3-methyladenine glycosylase II
LLAVKLGRNDLCICGSGRKVKRCCGTDGLRDRLNLVVETAEELLTLAFHFPRCRPESEAFEAWVRGLPPDPVDDAIIDGLAALDDDEVRARLVALPGIGEWTVDWFLARHLARPRAWPAGDLGLQKAVTAFYGDGRVLRTAEVRDFGARFEPWQNLTAHYLLTGLRVSPPG